MIKPRMRKLFTGLLLLLATMVLLHVVAATILLQQINNRLRTIPGYDGRVKAVHLGWLTPSVSARGFSLVKRDQKAPGAILSAQSIEADFFWTALWRGRFVLNVTLDKPDMLFLMRERRVGQARVTGLWRKPFEQFPSFLLNRLAMHHALLRFKNDDALPPIDVSFNDVDLLATSIANRPELVRSQWVAVEGRARMQGHAPLWLAIHVKPFSEQAEFDIQGALSDFNLPVMNSIMRYYTGLELEKGQLNMRLKLAAHGGAFRGRVQRSIDHLTIRKTDRGVITSVKENIAQAWLSGHEQPPTDRLEKEFEYAGPLGYLDHDTLLASVWVAKGAFIQALKVKVPAQVHPVPPEQALDEWAEFQAKQRKKAKRTD